jgi:hypothetical protein
MVLGVSALLISCYWLESLERRAKAPFFQQSMHGTAVAKRCGQKEMVKTASSAMIHHNHHHTHGIASIPLLQEKR